MTLGASVYTKVRTLVDKRVEASVARGISTALDTSVYATQEAAEISVDRVWQPLYYQLSVDVYPNEVTP